MVASITTARAVHQGELMGIAPSGKPVTIHAIDVLRIAGGKFVEHWSKSDILGALQQPEAVPPAVPTAGAR